MAKTLNVIVNIAVLGFLLFVALAPGGPLRSALAEHRVARERARAIESLWSELSSRPDSEVPLVAEFTDYECRYCREMHQFVTKGVESGEFRGVY